MPGYEYTPSMDSALPDAIPHALRKIADEYRASYLELSSSWQDDGAGLIWRDFAAILDRAAKSAEVALRKRNLPVT